MSEPAREFEFTGPAGVLRGEAEGEAEAPPIALLHGLTATRRVVTHGSRVLPRRGFRTLAYDARGHGASDPAAAAHGYRYPELTARPRGAARRRGARAPLRARRTLDGRPHADRPRARRPRPGRGDRRDRAGLDRRAADRGVAAPLGLAGRRARVRWGGGVHRRLRPRPRPGVARHDAAGRSRAPAAPSPPRGGRSCTAAGAALEPVRRPRRARAARRAGAGDREPRRGGPRASVRGRRGVGRAPPGREPGQRRGGGVPARLAGRPPLARRSPTSAPVRARRPASRPSAVRGPTGGFRQTGQRFQPVGGWG